MVSKLTVLVVLASLAIAYSAPISSAKLRFKVSGRNLPDKDNIGTTDGYFELYESTDNGKTKKKLFKSDTISDQENPNWGQIYEYQFERNKNQWWLFKLLDEDTLREDDTVGRTWINVADYVDKGQLVSARLDKDKGYIIIQSADKQSPPDANTPLGKLPLPAGTPTTANIRFKVAGSGLPTKDDVGFIPGASDPYVIIYATDSVSGKEREIGRSTTVSSTRNPNWGDTFNFQWDSKKDQRLRFQIYDEDNIRSDDKLGTGWMEVNDYMAKNQAYTLPLPKQGLLTISKA